MQSFTVDDDLVSLVWERARPKPFEQLSFSDALRRVLEVNGAEVPERAAKPASKLPSGDELLAELEQFSPGDGSPRQRVPKADLRELVRRGMLTEGQELFLIDYQGRRVADAKATVSGSKLKYKGKLGSMSPLAARLLQSAGFATSSYSGPRHWAKADGTSVWNLWLEVLKHKGAR
tara:strand:+ start:2785 stop:3312 length:528 start_codon:yes stop_codon:yes gene_type:complete